MTTWRHWKAPVETTKQMRAGGRDAREISADAVVKEGEDSHPPTAAWDSHPQRRGQWLFRQREQMEQRPEGVKWPEHES